MSADTTAVAWSPGGSCIRSRMTSVTSIHTISDRSCPAACMSTDARRFRIQPDLLDPGVSQSIEDVHDVLIAKGAVPAQVDLLVRLRLQSLAHALLKHIDA